jgi:hypothetical protein
MPGAQSASHKTQHQDQKKAESKQTPAPTGADLISLSGQALEGAQEALASPGRLNPAALRALQRTVGNRAVTTLLDQTKSKDGPTTASQALGIQPSRPIRPHPTVQRAKEASTTQEAIAIATTGPLKLLSDELAKPSPSAADIMKYISELGPGQREILRADEGSGGILDKLAKCAALSNQQMLSAVEMLNGPLLWSLTWINKKTGAAAAIGDAAYYRLLQSATKTQVLALLKSTTSSVLITNYAGNPLDLMVPILGAADLARYISASAAFAGWLIQKAGAGGLMIYFSTNTPAVLIRSLKISGKWTTFLAALPAGSQLAFDERPAYRLLFEAAAEGADKEKIFEKRFGQKETHTAEEWKNQGLSYWATLEGKEISQATQATGKEKGVFINDPNKNRLVNELLKKKPDPAACLTLLGSIPRTNMYQVRVDQPLLNMLARALLNAPDKVAQAVLLLEFATPAKALDFIVACGVAATLDKGVYHRLLFKTDAAGLADLIAQSTPFATLKTNSGINPLTITWLVSSDVTLSAFIRTQAAFSDWVMETAGASTYLEYLGRHTPATSGAALVTANKLDALLTALPVGFSLSPLSQQALYNLFKALTGLPEKKKLLKKRFELDDVSEEGTTAWTKESLERMWELISRLPPVLLKQTFKNLMRGNDVPTGSAGFSGVANHAGRVKLSFDTAKMDTLESGQFTEVGDKMRDYKIFDAGSIHEIGHTVDFKHAFSAVGSMLQTDNDLGAWKEYNPTNTNPQAEALYNILLTDSGNPIATWNQEAKDLTKKILLKAIKEHKKPSETSVAVKNAAVDVDDKNWIETTFDDYISDLDMTEIIEDYGNEGNAPWNTSFNKPVNNRAYHRAYPNEWVSYIKDARGTSKLSKYQFRDHEEYFAETFGTFYLTPDDPGKLVKEWNEKVYNWFVANVDKGYSTKKKA